MTPWRRGRNLNIYEALKLEHVDIRVTCGDRWMVWDEDMAEWKVWEHKPRARHTTVIYFGDSADEAVERLTEEARERAKEET